MSFEERSDEDQNDEAIGRVNNGDNGSQDVLISSTNEIDAFNNTTVFKRVNTLWISAFMASLSVRMNYLIVQAIKIILKLRI